MTAPSAASLDGRRATASPPRILAVTHELVRGGAPAVLLRLLRWLVDHDRAEVEVLALGDGPFRDDFAALGPLHVIPAVDHGVWLPPKRSTRPERAPADVYRLNAERVERLRPRAAHLRGFDLLYLNSALSARALGLLPERPGTVISHLHELDSAFDHWLDPLDRERLLAAADLFVVAAHCVGDHLVRAHGVDPAKVLRPSHELIGPATPDPDGTARARRTLGIPDSATVVGAVGTLGWRKGTDLFVQLAAGLRQARPDAEVHLVWLGSSTPESSYPYRHDIAAAGLGDRVHLVGEVADVDVPGWMGLFDVFALTSREDPFPLVCLEAGSLGVPVVSFANGGMAELAVADDPDDPLLTIVDYLDVAAMVDAVAHLVDQPDLRRRQGERLSTWLRSHALADTGARDVADAIDRLLHTSTGTAP